MIWGWADAIERRRDGFNWSPEEVEKGENRLKKDGLISNRMQLLDCSDAQTDHLESVISARFEDRTRKRFYKRAADRGEGTFPSPIFFNLNYCSKFLQNFCFRNSNVRIVPKLRSECVFHFFLGQNLGVPNPEDPPNYPTWPPSEPMEEPAPVPAPPFEKKSFFHHSKFKLKIFFNFINFAIWLQNPFFELSFFIKFLLKMIKFVSI